MRRKKVIRTSNKEIYEKLSLLHFSSSVVLENTTKQQLGKLLKNINRNNNILEVKEIGEYFIVKKKAPLNFSIYLK